ncbi:MAG TPA: hypothetical protein VG738_22540 [Chitinophagaceae bacterium]|nr:hypothetical protein [Puia sp.]HWB28276.1 hypothetical protein [Chitinophagaceae bacterium]
MTIPLFIAPPGSERQVSRPEVKGCSKVQVMQEAAGGFVVREIQAAADKTMVLELVLPTLPQGRRLAGFLHKGSFHLLEKGKDRLEAAARGGHLADMLIIDMPAPQKMTSLPSLMPSSFKIFSILMEPVTGHICFHGESG